MSPWHSPEREGRDSLTLANSSIRQWFRKLLIQENKDRASADGLAPALAMAGVTAMLLVE